MRPGAIYRPVLLTLFTSLTVLLAGCGETTIKMPNGTTLTAKQAQEACRFLVREKLNYPQFLTPVQSNFATEGTISGNRWTQQLETDSRSSLWNVQSSQRLRWTCSIDGNRGTRSALREGSLLGASDYALRSQGYLK